MMDDEMEFQTQVENVLHLFTQYTKRILLNQ